MLKKAVAVIAFWIICFSGGVVHADDAKQQLKGSIDRIIDLLKDQALKAPDRKSERRAKIFKVLEGRFDFAEMGKRSLAAQWKKISEKERKEFVATFARLMENSYISRIERYSDEEVVFKKEQSKGKYYHVQTEVVSGEKAIPVYYSLHRFKDEWFVYDVNIEGVSLVRTYRTEFKKTIRKEKFAGLMGKLKKKLSDLEREVEAE
jgi:phospholipid transport system substrate-binding protein